MRSRLAAPLLLLAALAAVPATAQVQGRYAMISINGNALPTTSPMQDWVTYVSSVFWLEPDGYASMSTRWDSRSGPSVQHVIGTYVAVRDSLRILAENGETVARFRWVSRGDTLRMYDSRGNTFDLLRDAPGASEPWRPGTWNGVQVNGKDLPAPWSHEPDVTVKAMTFTFGADGQATSRMTTSRNGREVTHEATHPYEMQGGRLTIPNLGQVFAWTIRDGTLRLSDPWGFTYRFQAAPAATAP